MMKKGILLFNAFLIAVAGMAQVSCSFDNNQNDPVGGYLQFFDNVTAYVYVDPTQDNMGQGPGCSSTGDFVLTSIEWPIADAEWFNNPTPANGTGVFQFGVYLLADSADICAGVGDNIWLSPVYTRTVQGTPPVTDYFLPTGAIPLNQPFYVTWKMLDWTGSTNQVMCPVWDGSPREDCRQFYSANDGDSFIPHEDFFGSSFNLIDVRINGFYEADQFAEVQFIHASADAAAQTVDIRVNGEFPDPSFDDLDFLCSTNTVIIAAGVNEITINPSNSIDASNPIETFSEDYSDGDKLIGVVHGIASGSGYTPSSAVAPLELSYIDPAQNVAESNGETDLVFFHAVTDVGQIDVDIQGGASIASAIEYGQSGVYVGIDTDTEELFIEQTGAELQNYVLPLDDLNLDNLSSVIILSGFENTSANSNGAALSCYISSPEGGCLEELNFINSIDENSLKPIKMYPNPVQNFVFFDGLELLDLGQVEIYDVIGNLMDNVSLTESINKLDVSDLSYGYYTVVFYSTKNEVLGLSKIVKSE